MSFFLNQRGFRDHSQGRTLLPELAIHCTAHNFSCTRIHLILDSSMTIGFAVRLAAGQFAFNRRRESWSTSFKDHCRGCADSDWLHFCRLHTHSEQGKDPHRMPAAQLLRVCTNCCSEENHNLQLTTRMHLKMKSIPVRMNSCSNKTKRNTLARFCCPKCTLSNRPIELWEIPHCIS